MVARGEEISPIGGGKIARLRVEEAGIDIDPRGRVINRGLIESAVYRVGLESTISQKGHRGSLVNRVESIRVDYENG